VLVLMKVCKINFFLNPYHRSGMSEHLKVKHPGPISCSHCGKEFSKYATLKPHIQQVHEHGEFACADEECYYRSNSRANVSQHFDQRHKNKIPCPYPGAPASCSESCRKRNGLYSYSSLLLIHLYKKANVAPFKCAHPNCVYKSPNDSHAKAHVQEVHFKKSITTKECAALVHRDEKLMEQAFITLEKVLGKPLPERISRLRASRSKSARRIFKSAGENIEM